ncbi:hypothetical protein [Lichenifustis flavocetrariae]|uniref:Uncharacterized protein n=1 Tax=Lichenifustis flavocetrariae TaxID=2949735 RepID=A0AA42CQT6_9HYPH|nr:hypothetical protein [Lichenifustis flavocetrariae]MCW6511777.1 hypothetical protein [Lichenifustis flavocetrariae]
MATEAEARFKEQAASLAKPVMVAGPGTKRAAMFAIRRIIARTRAIDLTDILTDGTAVGRPVTVLINAKAHDGHLHEFEKDLASKNHHSREAQADPFLKAEPVER